MHLPFDGDQFFEIFRLYNDAVWPAQVFLYVLATAGVVLAMRGRERDSRLAAGIIAFLWFWMALVYHWVFFRRINPAAVIFAVAFFIEAALVFWNGVWRPRLAFRFALNAQSMLGALFVAYALIGYPLIGMALGQRYPAMPTFGVPCPTTIFTLGLLLWCDAKAVRWITVIPVVWAFIAMQAAMQLRVSEDWGLAAAAAISLAAILSTRVRGARAA